MEASSKGEQCPEEAVAPWMEWNSKALFSWKILRPLPRNVLYRHSSGKEETIPLMHLDPTTTVYGLPYSLVFNFVTCSEIPFDSFLDYMAMFFL
jgi:hypothetical protein